MSEGNQKRAVISGLAWRFAERMGAQIVSFAVSIVLARLLMPKDYGVIALVTIFITLSNVFVSGGFGNSLVQKKDADQLDFSTVFYFSIILSFGFYTILFFTAPLIADFYHNDILTPILRIMGLRLPVAAVNSVQQAYVSRNMMFKRFFFSTLGGTLFSAVVGIAMAYMGYGVWALVAQYLTNCVIDTLVLWFTVRWRPSLEFSFERLKWLFSYGWKILVSQLIDTLYNNLRSLIIGKKYKEDDLAYYNRGYQFPSLIVTNINSSIDSVLFPAIANVQDDKVKVKAMTRRAIVTSTFAMMPLLAGLAAIAKPLVKLLLTEKWISCVPFLQIFCFTFALMPIHTANLQAIKAMGRSDLFLKLEIIKKIFGLVIIFITMNFGVMAIAIGSLLGTLFGSVVNAFPNKKLLNYGYIEQIKDILPATALSLFMAAVVYCISFINLPAIALMTIQVIVGGLIYIGLSYLFKMESYFYIINTVKGFMKRKPR